jgi:hypothetical protein
VGDVIGDEIDVRESEGFARRYRDPVMAPGRGGRLLDV